MNIKMFNGNDLPNALALTARQTTKLINTIENNSYKVVWMSIRIKFSKTQKSKIIQFRGFLG